jgi:hypothetical protein
LEIIPIQMGEYVTSGQEFSIDRDEESVPAAGFMLMVRIKCGFRRLTASLSA